MTPEQLKNSILQLAIQGKLVKQRKEEGTGEELFKDIQEEKLKLIKDGKLKKQKSLPEITEDEVPFDIPETWKWVKLGELVTIYGGKRIPAGRKLSLSKTEHVYIRVSDMKDGYVSNEKLQYVPNDIYEKISNYIIKKEDVFITVAGTIGRVGKIPHELDGANLTENADRLVFSIINQDWLIKTLQSNLVQQQIKNTTTKVGQPKLAINKIQTIVVPLPPLAEQKRIVEKIEELLPLVDRYEKAWSRLEELNKKFPLDMQKSILQEAIQGKLVEQRKEEGTSEELFKDIQEEKQKLIKEGKLKKQKALSEITEDEIPFDIPETWKWVRLGEIGDWGSGATPSRTNVDFYGGDIPWLKTGDLTDGYIYDVPECITKFALEKTSVRLNPKGSILIAMYGATIGKLGILTKAMTTNQACCACIVFPSVYNLYLFYFLLANRNRFIKQGEGGAQPNISKDKIINSLIPLPPLAEQKRIVEKIEELLPLCERLK
ncbi:MAG: restriction endonuclease subunit S [[Eubacterium] sulci]|nr:restriction endonuclease subunit S [[Eubacterium] sulci]